MKNQQPKDITYKKTWTIKDFSKLKTECLYSDVFTFGDTAWRVLLYPEGNNIVGFLSLYLEAADAASLPKGWNIYTEYSLAVVNHDSKKSPKKEDGKRQFCAEAKVWGFLFFMPLSILHDPNSGFIFNDTCVIEVECSILKSEGTRKDSSEEYEFIDFRGLGKIEKSFVPMLEEVCLWHPSLVECQKKRTRRFTEWTFTALGRVLHFLKTKKGQDMIESEDACENLQHLWEELQTCRLDLTWLEPYVQSALGMKKAYMEKAEQAKKLKENLAVYETEMEKLRETQLFSRRQTRKKLREKLANTKENVEKVKKIGKGTRKEDFEGRDVNAELGCGKEKP